MCATAAWAQEFDSSEFSRKMPITFSGYAGGETLANFPALVRLDFELTREMKAGGADLRFTDAGNVLLPYEVDTWDTDGLSTVWVGIPSLAPHTTAITAIKAAFP